MRKAQFAGMQSRSFKFNGKMFHDGVFAVPNDGVIALAHLDADLIGPSRQRKNFRDAKMLSTFHHAVMHNG